MRTTWPFVALRVSMLLNAGEALCQPSNVDVGVWLWLRQLVMRSLKGAPAYGVRLWSLVLGPGASRCCVWVRPKSGVGRLDSGVGRRFCALRVLSPPAVG